MKKIDIYSDTSAYVIGSLGFLIFFCLAVPVTISRVAIFGDVFDITWCRNSNAGVDVSL